MSESRESSLTYLPHVDGLRALAIGLVVAYHAWPSAVPGGYIGVDVFFVISGFIITRQIFSEMETGRFSLIAFLGRRVRRLMPAAAVCFALVAVGSAVLLSPEALMDFGRSLGAAVGMVANVYFYRTSGYFAGESAEKPLLHTWSLAVEDQFYLTWPLILLLMVRGLGGRWRMLAVVAVLGLASLAHAETSGNRDYAFYWLLPRAFELLLGCGLALAAAGRSAVPTLPLAGWLGLAVLAASAFLLDGASRIPGLAVVPCCLATALVIWHGLGRSDSATRLLSWRPVVGLGKISYSLYLYHWPLLALATVALGRAPDASEAVPLVALALVLGVLSWWLVEQRLTRSLGLYVLPPLRIIGLGAVTSVTLGLLAVAMVAGKGWFWRLDATSAAVYAAAATSNPLRPACDGHENALRRDERCRFGARKDGGHELVLLGDSNADHFVAMLDELGAEAGFSGRQVTQSACGPLIGIELNQAPTYRESCRQYQATILRYLDAHPELKVAVLGAAWSIYEAPGRISALGERLGFGRQGDPDSFRAALKRTIALFRQRGIRVVLMGQIPYPQAFSLACFARTARRGTFNEGCAGQPRAGLPKAWHDKRDALAEAAAGDDGVRFVDMLDVMCPGGMCSTFRDGVFLYRDKSHLSATGSRLLAKAVGSAWYPSRSDSR